MRIPFNKPFLTGKETKYIEDAVTSGKISGNGFFTQKCQAFFEGKYEFKKCLLTTSCTDALEMAAILCNIQEGDEVIVPSYTFVSSALAFVRQGAKIIFADSRSDHPGIDEHTIEALITSRTKAIVVVHYAGVACDMDAIIKIAEKHNLYIIEDAAQAIDSYYKSRSLGGLGHLAAFSFHETKNVISGEGGMLVINDKKLRNRADIVWEKGTNRTAFFKGEIDKYSWVDLGSSFLPSEIVAAFLFAQLEKLESIQDKRKKLWKLYYAELLILEEEAQLKLPVIPKYATNNAHMFYIIVKDLTERDNLLRFLRQNGIHAVFHYLSLHKSPYYSKLKIPAHLKNADFYSNCLIRLPLYYDLKEDEAYYVCNVIKSYFK